MNPLTQSNLFFSALFEDSEVSAAFGTDRTLAHFLAFEIALTEGLAASGAVDTDMAKRAIEKMRGFVPDLDAIAKASGRMPITLGIGDGANDIPMIKAATYGFAYCAKPKAKLAANGVIESGDLAKILPLLGLGQ